MKGVLFLRKSEYLEEAMAIRNTLPRSIIGILYESYLEKFCKVKILKAKI